MRLEDIPFSFDNLSVLDIGCNQGGMLYELSNRIKFGVGVDYDSRMINVANKMKSHCKLNNLDYFVFDLEKENLDYLSDFLPEDKVDVVFLLSICMWIENWREVVAKIPTISRKLIFESNGKPEQQQEQIDELKSIIKPSSLSEKSPRTILLRRIDNYFTVRMRKVNFFRRSKIPALFILKSCVKQSSSTTSYIQTSAKNSVFFRILRSKATCVVPSFTVQNGNRHT